MKNLKYVIHFIILSILVLGCQDEDKEFGDIIAPSNIVITAEIVGADDNNPNGDGSGVVNFSATADNVTSFKYVYDGNEFVTTSGKQTLSFSTLGLNTYTVSVVASGIGGSSSSETIQVDVLSTYSPPQDLLDKLHGGSSKTWRIKAEVGGHFGLGPVAGTTPTEWYGAQADEKAGVGMYDDRYIFNQDGTFQHITNADNDATGNDPTGTVFGRVTLVDELGSSGGSVNGADVENLPYDDNAGTYTLTAPGDVETITLSGLGFIGYYIGGNHAYEIFDRSKPNEILLRSTDGNGEFDWWFIITTD